MTDIQARKFAEEWIRNFSAKDAEAVLAWFSEDAKFTSPRAVGILGRATLRSREELGEYWRTAVKAIGSIRFTMDYLVNDEAARRLTIVYVSDIDGKRARAAEFFQFDEKGKVMQGEAMYGAVLG
jgi:SnoaL-like protein